MSKQKDITGERFGRLVAVERTGYKNGKSRWKCLCDCGNEVDVIICSLTGGKTQSCGCLRKETAAKQGANNATHGMYGSRLWVIWSGMKERCNRNPNYTNVEICEEWKNSFEAFYTWAVNNGYSDELTIDRIDVYGDYTPDNCRWATYKEQGNNRTNTVYVSVFGETKTITDWCDESGISRETLKWRLKSNWPDADLFIPVNLGNSRIRKGRYINAE